MGNTTQSFDFPQLETRAEIAIQPRYGIPDWHYGQTQIKHNSLLNWGSN